MQPTIEFIFSVTEEAVYAHAIISAKLVTSFVSQFISATLFSYYKVLFDSFLLCFSGYKGL